MPELSTNPPKRGKPSTYTREIAKEICEKLSDGIPLREICRSDPKFPAWRTVYDWMRKDPELSTAIAYARDMGYDALAEECLDIADNASNDWMERTDDKNKTASWVLNGEHVQRSKLRIETRLKLLAKFNPKKYGESVRHMGDEDNPLVVDVMAKEVVTTLIKNIEMKRQLQNAG